jgi:hypothetical protein
MNPQHHANQTGGPDQRPAGEPAGPHALTARSTASAPAVMVVGPRDHHTPPACTPPGRVLGDLMAPADRRAR